jgi:hypothetical protein
MEKIYVLKISNWEDKGIHFMLGQWKEIECTHTEESNGENICP